MPDQNNNKIIWDKELANNNNKEETKPPIPQSGGSIFVDEPMEANKAPAVDTEKEQIFGQNVIYPELAPGTDKTPKTPEHSPERIYESDFDTAIHSKEGGVVASIIEEARAKEAEREASSPRSLKNIIFMAVSAILIVLAIVLLVFIFVEREPRIIEDKTVSSLIYADVHTGLDVTDLATIKTIALIGRVLPQGLPTNNIRQIYYLEQNGEVYHRLNTAEVFGATGNPMSEGTFDAFGEDFMHGVHSADQLNPFLVLTVDSYEGAFDATREWEKTMVDDLSPFMNFPQAISERIPGDDFVDEVIENKPVRVLRYTPKPTATTFLDSVTTFLAKFVDISGFYNQIAFAQDAETDQIFTPFDQYDVNDPLVVCSLLNPADESATYPKIISLKEVRDLYIMGLQEGHEAEKEKAAKYGCVKTVQTVSNFDVYKDLGESVRDVCVYNPNKVTPTTGGGVVNILEDAPFVILKSEILLKPNSAQWLASYDCYPSIGNSNLDLQKQEVLFQNGLAKVCFDSATGERVPSSDICFDPVICIDKAGKYYKRSSSAIEEGCFVSLDIASMEKIDKYACWNNVFDLVSVIQGDKGATCFDAFATTAGQFESIYSLDNLRGVLRQASSVLVIGAKLAEMLMLDKLPGGDLVVDTMYSVAKGMAYISYIDVLEVDEIRTILGFVQDTENLILKLENYGFPENYITAQIKDYINIIKEFLGLKHNLQWITINGFLDDQNYLDEKAYIYAGGTSKDVGVVQQALYNLGLLSEEIVITSGEIDIGTGEIGEDGFIDSGSATLDSATQEAIRAFQTLNSLPVTGIMDLETMSLLEQIINSGTSIVGTEYDFERFSYFTVTDFLGMGGVLITQSGEILSGENLSDPEFVAQYEDMTVEEFVNGGGKIYPSRLESGEEVSVITSKLWRELRRGHYGRDVQTVQIVLREEGIDVDSINGIYDEFLEDNIKNFQREMGLEETGIVDEATRTVINDIIERKSLNQSGYYLGGDGYLKGYGEIKTIEQSGLDILPTEASGGELQEGDLILMYLFLDENTLLFTQSAETTREIIRRKANSQLSPE